MSADGVFSESKPDAESENQEPVTDEVSTSESAPESQPEQEPCSEVQAKEELKQSSLPQNIVARSLTLVSECGKSRITLKPYPDIAGLWIEAAPDGDKYPRSCIAIYDDKQQGPVIGFYRDVGEENLAMHFAISLGENSQPTLQVDNGRGGYGSIGLHEILDKVKPEWRSE